MGQTGAEGPGESGSKVQSGASPGPAGCNRGTDGKPGCRVGRGPVNGSVSSTHVQPSCRPEDLPSLSRSETSYGSWGLAQVTQVSSVPPPPSLQRPHWN